MTNLQKRKVSSQNDQGLTTTGKFELLLDTSIQRNQSEEQIAPRYSTPAIQQQIYKTVTHFPRTKPTKPKSKTKIRIYTDRNDREEYLRRRRTYSQQTDKRLIKQGLYRSKQQYDTNKRKVYDTSQIMQSFEMAKQKLARSLSQYNMVRNKIDEEYHFSTLKKQMNSINPPVHAMNSSRMNKMQRICHSKKSKAYNSAYKLVKSKYLQKQKQSSVYDSQILVRKQAYKELISKEFRNIQSKEERRSSTALLRNYTKKEQNSVHCSPVKSAIMKKRILSMQAHDVNFELPKINRKGYADMNNWFDIQKNAFKQQAAKQKINDREYLKQINNLCDLTMYKVIQKVRNSATESNDFAQLLEKLWTNFTPQQENQNYSSIQFQEQQNQRSIYIQELKRKYESKIDYLNAHIVHLQGNIFELQKEQSEYEKQILQHSLETKSATLKNYIKDVQRKLLRKAIGDGNVEIAELRGYCENKLLKIEAVSQTQIMYKMLLKRLYLMIKRKYGQVIVTDDKKKGNAFGIKHYFPDFALKVLEMHHQMEKIKKKQAEIDPKKLVCYEQKEFLKKEQEQLAAQTQGHQFIKNVLEQIDEEMQDLNNMQTRWNPYQKSVSTQVQLDILEMLKKERLARQKQSVQKIELDKKEKALMENILKASQQDYIDRKRNLAKMQEKHRTPKKIDPEVITELSKSDISSMQLLLDVIKDSFNNDKSYFQFFMDKISKSKQTKQVFRQYTLSWNEVQKISETDDYGTLKSWSHVPYPGNKKGYQIEIEKKRELEKDNQFFQFFLHQIKINPKAQLIFDQEKLNLDLKRKTTMELDFEKRNKELEAKLKAAESKLSQIKEGQPQSKRNKGKQGGGKSNAFASIIGVTKVKMKLKKIKKKMKVKFQTQALDVFDFEKWQALIMTVFVYYLEDLSAVARIQSYMFDNQIKRLPSFDFAKDDFCNILESMKDTPLIEKAAQITEHILNINKPEELKKREREAKKQQILKFQKKMREQEKRKKQKSMSRKSVVNKRNRNNTSNTSQEQEPEKEEEDVTLQGSSILYYDDDEKLNYVKLLKFVREKGDQISKELMTQKEILSELNCIFIMASKQLTQTGTINLQDQTLHHFVKDPHSEKLSEIQRHKHVQFLASLIYKRKTGIVKSKLFGRFLNLYDPYDPKGKENCIKYLNCVTFLKSKNKFILTEDCISLLNMQQVLLLVQNQMGGPLRESDFNSFKEKLEKRALKSHDMQVSYEFGKVFLLILEQQKEELNNLKTELTFIARTIDQDKSQRIELDQFISFAQTINPKYFDDEFWEAAFDRVAKIGRDGTLFIQFIKQAQFVEIMTTLDIGLTMFGIQRFLEYHDKKELHKQMIRLKLDWHAIKDEIETRYKSMHSYDEQRQKYVKTIDKYLTDEELQKNNINNQKKTQYLCRVLVQDSKTRIANKIIKNMIPENIKAWYDFTKKIIKHAK